MKTLILLLISLNLSAAPRWDKENNPKDLLAAYETKFDNLKKAAKLSVRPWADTYWATMNGGITYRWNAPKGVERIRYDLLNMDELTEEQIKYLSPAEKFDLYVGDKDWSLTKFERQRTEIMTKNDIASWWGLCHSVAPASVLYQNPNPVTLEGATGVKIPFGASDVKALIAFHLDFIESDANQTYFVGGRCELDALGIVKEYLRGLFKKRPNNDCNDTNAATFHLALTNLIGIKDQPFIIDNSRDKAVWNHPINSYDIKINWRKKAGPIQRKKGFHEIVSVNATVEVINSGGFSWETSKPSTSRFNKYGYYLYLNKDGHIVGGKWKTGFHNRPDFMWWMSMPRFSSGLYALEDIYNASVGRTTGVRGNPGKTFKSAVKRVINMNRMKKGSANYLKRTEAARDAYYKKILRYLNGNQ